MKIIKILLLITGLLLQNHVFSQEVSAKNLRLLMAAYEGKTDSVIHLLMDTADVNARSEEGITPLMYAAEQGHEDIVKILLYNKADPNLVPFSGRTALMSAAMQNYPEIVYDLLIYGADINAADDKNATALIYSCLYNLDYMTEYLLQCHADPQLKTTDSTNALLCAAWAGNSQVAALLMAHQVAPDSKDSNGFSPLSVALQNGDLALLDTLLAHKASPRIGIKSHPGINAIDYARILNQKLTIKTMRQQGVRGSIWPWFSKITLNYTPASFSIEDYYMGAGIGLLDTKYNIHIELGYNSRIAKKRILEPQSDSVSWQLWERRRHIYLNAEKLFTFPTVNPNKRQGIFIRFKGIYSFGAFEGLNRRPEAVFAFVPGVGYTYMYKNVFVKAGYEYARTDTFKSSPHWISVTVGACINFRKKPLTKTISWM